MSLGIELPAVLDGLCNEKGFLRDSHLWTRDIALAFAQLERLELTDAHWEILVLLREFYAQYDASPANRALVNYVKKLTGPDKGNSLYLMALFPGSPARIGSRIAGLPKPKNCL